MSFCKKGIAPLAGATFAAAIALQAANADEPKQYKLSGVTQPYGDKLGGTGGTITGTSQCKGKEFPVGVWTKKDGYVHGIGLICGHLASDGTLRVNSQFPPRNNRIEGTDQAEVRTYMCGENEIIRGITARHGSYVNRISSMFCSGFELLSSRDANQMNIVQVHRHTTDLSVPNFSSTVCPEGYVLSRLKGKAGQWLDQLSTECGKVEEDFRLIVPKLHTRPFGSSTAPKPLSAKSGMRAATGVRHKSAIHVKPPITERKPDLTPMALTMALDSQQPGDPKTSKVNLLFENRDDGNIALGNSWVVRFSGDIAQTTLFHSAQINKGRHNKSARLPIPCAEQGSPRTNYSITVKLDQLRNVLESNENNNEKTFTLKQRVCR